MPLCCTRTTYIATWRRCANRASAHLGAGIKNNDVDPRENDAYVCAGYRRLISVTGPARLGACPYLPNSSVLPSFFRIYRPSTRRSIPRMPPACARLAVALRYAGSLGAVTPHSACAFVIAGSICTAGAPLPVDARHTSACYYARAPLASPLAGLQCWRAATKHSALRLRHHCLPYGLSFHHGSHYHRRVHVPTFRGGCTGTCFVRSRPMDATPDLLYWRRAATLSFAAYQSPPSTSTLN